MSDRDAHSEEELGRLLAMLPSAPSDWVEAAQALPHTLADLDDILTRLQEDAGFRRAFRADPRRTLERSGLSADADVLAVVRARLAQTGD